MLNKSLIARACGLVATTLVLAALTPAALPPAGPIARSPVAKPPIDPVIARIRDEGLNHSKVADTLDYLCNVIGQRLTGSPSQQRASEWTRDTLKAWGLVNSHLEPWGPFGRGWQLDRFSIRMTAPYPLTLTACPKAWSNGFESPGSIELVYLDGHTLADLEKYTGKLRGKAVLIGTLKSVETRFDPHAVRLTADELAKLATSSGETSELMYGGVGGGPATRPSATTAPMGSAPASSAPAPRPRGGMLAQAAAQMFASRALDFAAREGAAVVIDGSTHGDGGTIFVAQASVPVPVTLPTTRSTTEPAPWEGRGGGRMRPNRPKPWAPDASTGPAQITLTAEDFNRLVHMISLGQSIKLAVDLKVTFYPPTQVNPADTVAEIPGSDLKDQIVMVGGHLDSWHSGEGATDNAAGAAGAMEAVRILESLNLHPRRTIRICLWTGEEQGLYGSSDYVKKHFGSYPDDAATQPTTRPTRRNARPSSTAPAPGLVKGPEYERLSAYFNLDNGTGKIRGIYAQDNPVAAGYFRQWLAPFADLDATTVTLANTGSTDHIPFDQIGLPGFQFIQDPIDYINRTHHSNADVFERLQLDDMKQAATIMAAFLWDTANMDQRFPRKPSSTFP